MILLGLPPTVANGTNRIGLIVGNLSSMLNLKKHGYLYMPVFKQLFTYLIGSFFRSCALVKIAINYSGYSCPRYFFRCLYDKFKETF